MQHLNHWGLAEPPFQNTRDPRYFYRSSGHREALARLEYLIDDRNMGIGLLTGEIGSGKTMLAYALTGGLKRAEHVFVYTENSNYPFVHLMSELLQQLKGQWRSEPAPEKYRLIQEFKQYIEKEILPNRRHLVFVLDEAQEIRDEEFAELKYLLNIHSATQNYLTLLFIGQPELRSQIKALPQLDQRIGMRYTLNALPASEIGPYVQHRLTVAGHPSGEVFAEDAGKMLYRVTRGIPREINRLCKLAMDLACSRGATTIGNDLLLSIIRDLHQQDGLPLARAGA